MIEKHEIKAIRGKTICYAISNIQIYLDKSTINISWDPFYFYTPEGNLIDEEGNKYFEVSGLNETFTRDTADKELFILIKLVDNECNIYVIEKILENKDEIGIVVSGMEGDEVLTGIIPSDPTKEIYVGYKEIK